MIATRCLPEGRDEGGRAEIGDEGRVTAGVVTVEPMSSRANLSEADEADDDMVEMWSELMIEVRWS